MIFRFRHLLMSVRASLLAAYLLLYLVQAVHIESDDSHEDTKNGRLTPTSELVRQSTLQLDLRVFGLVRETKEVHR